MVEVKACRCYGTHSIHISFLLSLKNNQKQWKNKINKEENTISLVEKKTFSHWHKTKSMVENLYSHTFVDSIWYTYTNLYIYIYMDQGVKLNLLLNIIFIFYLLISMAAMWNDFLSKLWMVDWRKWMRNRYNDAAYIYICVYAMNNEIYRLIAFDTKETK